MTLTRSPTLSSDPGLAPGPDLALSKPSATAYLDPNYPEQVLACLWPTWCGIAPAAARAGVEDQVLPALCRLAQEALRAVRAH